MQYTVITRFYHTNTALEGQVCGLCHWWRLEALLAAGRGLEGGWFQPGATGTRWDKVGMGANQVEKVSVGVWRENVHFDGCLVCVWGSARVVSVCRYTCTYICINKSFKWLS